MKPGTIKVVKADSDSADKVWVKSLKSRYIPLVVKYKKDADGVYKEVARFVGAVSYEKLKDFATK